MRSLIVSLALAITACGGDPFIQTGDYDVSSFFVRDDFLGQAGKESTTVWTIEEKDGKYTITVMNGPKDASGSVDNDSLTIYKEEELSCGGTTSFSATVTPRGDNNAEFTGVANLAIDLCALEHLGETQTLFVEAHLVGEKK